MPLDRKVWDGMQLQSLESQLGQSRGRLGAPLHHHHILHIRTELPEEDMIWVSACWNLSGFGKWISLLHTSDLYPPTFRWNHIPHIEPQKFHRIELQGCRLVGCFIQRQVDVIVLGNVQGWKVSNWLHSEEP